MVNYQLVITTGTRQSTSTTSRIDHIARATRTQSCNL